MRKRLLGFALIAAAVAIAGCSTSSSNTVPGPSESPTATASPVPTSTVGTPTPTPLPTTSATPAPVPSFTWAPASCGVERWAVKTGTDADVGQVDLSSVNQTTIKALASIPAPPQSALAPDARVAPTETTVFQVDATLVKYKQEADSDYHLVLSDGNGNTMIAEIPDPYCVGTSSPFLAGIETARAAFDARYNVTGSWQYANAAVTVTGVGFFDFLHGQSGVAPNGIELHSVLAIAWGD